MTTGGASARMAAAGAPPVHTLVVGVGNEDRGDDALGPLAARLLARAWGDAPPPGLRVLAWTGDPTGLLDVWTGVQRLVLIDAMVSGAAPGTCCRYAGDAPFVSAGATSSHGFGLAGALALARALGRAPPAVEVWGIEGARFGAGEPLTPAVRAAVEALVARLERELAAPGPADEAHAPGTPGTPAGSPHGPSHGPSRDPPHDPSRDPARS